MKITDVSIRAAQTQTITVDVFPRFESVELILQDANTRKPIGTIMVTIDRTDPGITDDSYGKS